MDSYSELHPLVVVLEKDSADQYYLHINLRSVGYQILFYDEACGLKRDLFFCGLYPSILIVDFYFFESQHEILNQIVDFLNFIEKPFPIICISYEDDQDARLIAQRSSAIKFITRPIDYADLLSSINTCKESKKPYKALVVDSNRTRRDEYFDLLSNSGFLVRSLEEANNFLNEYDQYEPDVTLMEVGLPEVSGLELASIIEDYKGPQRSGIILLTDDAGKELCLSDPGCCADDILVKSSRPTEIMASALMRAKASRKMGQMSEYIHRMHKKMNSMNGDRHREHQALNQHAIVSRADKKGLITYVNELFCQISGYRPAELVGQDHRVLKSGYHTAEFYQEIWFNLLSGRVWQGEICNRRKDGSLYWVESTITPFFDDKGKVKEYISIRTDITKIKEVEKQLRDSEKEQKKLAWERGERIKEAKCLSSIMQLINNERLGIEDILEQAADLIPQGYKDPDSTFSVIHFSGHSFKSKNFLRTACCYEVKGKVHCVDGRDEDLQVEVFTFESNTSEALPGSCTAFLSEERLLLEQLADQLAQAIGRRKDREALQKAKEEAERANKAKSEFLSSMSHELRTPMHAILGFAQMLDQDDDLAEDQKDSAHEIIKAGKHLLTLINDVLDLAKIEAGKLSLSLEPVNLNAILDECLPLLKTMASSRSIKISYEISPELHVVADRVRLKQVLINLCSNAIKYNEEKGQVRVSAWLQGSKKLRIAVEDTGQGIPEESLDVISQPFNRLNAESSSIEGTGIGLSISRKLVQAMGGKLGVESVVGVGSTFWFELDFYKNENSGVSLDIDLKEEFTVSGESKEELPDPSIYRVLSIDDNPTNLKLVEQFMKRRTDISLCSAHLPGIGIQHAKASKPDLILLDINMPEMSGYEVLKVLRSDPKLKKVPVIAVTANALPNDIKKGLQLGFNDYLTKPLDLDRFNRVLDAWLIEDGDHAF